MGFSINWRVVFIGVLIIGGLLFKVYFRAPAFCKLPHLWDLGWGESSGLAVQLDARDTVSKLRHEPCGYLESQVAQNKAMISSSSAMLTELWATGLPAGAS